MVRMLSQSPPQRVGTAHAPKALGVGLAVCRKAIKEHGDQFEAESEPGQGSTVTIILPRAKPSHVPREQRIPHPGDSSPVVL
jgi:signal transduction histidine kinase